MIPNAEAPLCTQCGRPISVSAMRIIEICADACGVSVTRLLSPRRERDISEHRAVAAYLIDKHCDHMNWTMIGRVMGGREHSYAVRARDAVVADLTNGGNRFGPIVNYVEGRMRAKSNVAHPRNSQVDSI